MLDECAPKYTKRAGPHLWCIRWNGKVYPSLPLGPHGRRENPEIQIGHVRKMARFLGILECAETRIPMLNPPSKQREKEAGAP